PTGSRFTFGRELAENTEVYAKWNANTSASYSIIIWKQNINGDGYDFEEIITMSGNVGDPINTVSRQGSGATSYARINNSNYQYTGFHLESFDQNVRIKTEGNAVLNVYYDRNEYTLHFQAQTTEYTYTPTTSNSGTQYGLVNGEYVQLTRHGKGNNNNPYYWTYGNNIRYTGTRYTRSSNTGWHNVETITALFGQSILDRFPITNYDNGVWEAQNSATYGDLMLVFIDAMPAENVTFRLKSSSSGDAYNMQFWVQPTSLSSNHRDYEMIHSARAYNSNIYLTYNEDFVELVGFDRETSDPAFVNNRISHSGYGTMTVKFYYTRRSYTINYMNGAYYDGNNNNLRTDGGTQIETKSGIAYGKDISSYNSHNPDPSHIPDGYVFEGWYADKTCTRPFVFTTMPEGGITVYAKWRQIQYRVFLHPNVDAEDISLNWGSDEQAMNFRINYGDKVSTPTGIRADYEFVGWYTDERFMRAFDQNAIVLNETTVRTAYNKTTDYTDPMDKYGNIGDDPYNSDAIGNNGGDRFWITKKYDLYGKWRAILRGAIGINVEYVVGDGNNAPTDTHLYQDHAYAIAGHASSHETKEFSHWVLQHWNGDEYVDTDIDIYPGATFLVQKRDAKMHDAAWYNSNEEEYTGGPFDTEGLTAPDPAYTIFRATYTIKLRAEYVDVEQPEHTFVE
ncbi:MAG: InlB B-repeat-containing protein, partial [Bacteroidales bacterium]|nr:InlB B-repeat-containing protein [Bacteroidales bacterium]